MPTPTAPATAAARPTLGMIAITALALVLTLAALLSGVFGLLAPGNTADSLSALPNLLTGIAGIAGIAGYWLRRTWGVLFYGLSTLGHIGVHSAFIAADLGQPRFTLVALGVLLLVPLLSLLVLGGMAWQWRRGGLR